MSYGRIVGLVAVVVMGAALVLGCGDDGEASSSVTKAEFIKEAEAVCDERKKEWEAAATSYSKKLSAKAAEWNQKKERQETEALLSNSLLPLLKTELEALEDLGVPQAEEAKIDKMLQSRAAEIEELEDKGVRLLIQENPFLDFEKEASALGLSCTLQ